MRWRYIHIAIITSLVCTVETQAQLTNVSLNRQLVNSLEAEVTASDSAIHSTWKPYSRGQVAKAMVLTADKETSWIKRKLISENLVVLNEGGLQLYADPLLHLEVGRDLQDATPSRLTYNSRGFIVEGEIGNKVGFFSSFRENQAFVPDYLTAHVLEYDNMPGDGRVKPFKVNGFDYAAASGYVSLNLAKNVNMQFGHDKRFIGDGYRSLLLSDNSFNFPFLQLSSTMAKGKIRLNNLYASLQSLNRLPYNTTPEALFQRKAGTFHHLSVIPVKGLQLGIFEGIIWQRTDTTDMSTMSFNPAMVNPVPGIGVAINGLSGDNNALFGLTARYNAHEKVYVYGQYMLDDVELQKSGVQLGVRGFNLLTKGLHVQAEFNKVSSYTYGHSVVLQNYAHYNQPLAHPIGAGFTEYVSIVDYERKRLFARAQMTFVTLLDDQDTLHLGNDIFKRDNAQSLVPFAEPTQHILNVGLNVAYMINPASRLQVFIDLRERINMRASGFDERMRYIGFGMRTALWNTYYDF